MRRAKLSGAAQAYNKKGMGAKPSTAVCNGDLSEGFAQNRRTILVKFREKNSHFNDIWIIFCTFLQMKLKKVSRNFTSKAF